MWDLYCSGEYSHIFPHNIVMDLNNVMPKGTPKECIELRILLHSTPKFQIVCRCCREEEGLYANSRVEEESSQSNDNRRLF